MNGDWFNGGANINSSRLVPPQHVRIGNENYTNENYTIGAAGLRMPAKKAAARYEVFLTGRGDWSDQVAEAD